MIHHHFSDINNGCYLIHLISCRKDQHRSLFVDKKPRVYGTHFLLTSEFHNPL